MKVDITIQTEEHPACFLQGCEGEHLQENIHMKFGRTTFVFTEGTDEAKILKRILISASSYHAEATKSKCRILRAKAICACGETLEVRRMLTDLYAASIQCKHNS